MHVELDGATVAYAELTTTRLWFEEVGTGPRCLVMHGGLGIDHEPYRPGLDPLAEHLRVVYYDHRGHGRSDRVSHELAAYVRSRRPPDRQLVERGRKP